jgi:hypothetical protein
MRKHKIYGNLRKKVSPDCIKIEMKKRPPRRATPDLVESG